MEVWRWWRFKDRDSAPGENLHLQVLLRELNYIKKGKQKHLLKKTFQLTDISGDLINLTQKGKDSSMTCFCGFSH